MSPPAWLPRTAGMRRRSPWSPPGMGRPARWRLKRRPALQLSQDQRSQLPAATVYSPTNSFWQTNPQNMRICANQALMMAPACLLGTVRICVGGVKSLVNASTSDAQVDLIRGRLSDRFQCGGVDKCHPQRRVRAEIDSCRWGETVARYVDDRISRSGPADGDTELTRAVDQPISTTAVAAPLFVIAARRSVRK